MGTFATDSVVDLWPDKVPGATLKPGQDPRTVVKASDMQAIESALVDLKKHGLGWVSVRDYTLDGPGLVSAAAAAASTGLLIDAPVVIATAVGTISVPVRFSGSGKLVLNAGGSVTLSGALEAPLTRIFDTSGGGTLTFSAKVERVVPQWWGAVGDDGGATDSTAAIQAAVAALGAAGGTVLFPPGTYRIASPLPFKSGILYRGASYGAANMSPTGASEIRSSASSIFASSGTTSGVAVEHLTLRSQAGGGHIFDWSAPGAVTNVEIRNVVLIQGNAGKAVVQATTSDGVFVVWMHDFSFSYAAASTVPALYFANPFTSHITIENFYAFGPNVDSEYAITVEGTSSAQRISDVTVRSGVFEQCAGGAVQFKSVQMSRLEGLRTWDLSISPTKAFVSLTRSASSTLATRGIRVENLYAESGSAANPDLFIDGQTGYTADVTILDSRIGWLHGGSYVAKAIVIGSEIANSVNVTQTTIRDSTFASASIITAPAATLTGALTAGSGNIRTLSWAGSAATDTGLHVNAGSYGATSLLMLSRQWDVGNNTASAIYLVRHGYDANNYATTFVAGTDFATFSTSGGTLWATVALGGNMTLGIITTRNGGM